MQILVQKFSTGLGFFGLMLLGFQGAALAADGDTCTSITSVPFTISLPGTYCVTKELPTPSTFTSGVAITISSNDVTIDLSGHTLSNLAAGTGTAATGIYALDQKNITVRNGTVRGFYIGIDLDATGSGASSGHLVENVRADFNSNVGIQVLGAGSMVRQNQVLHTGGSTVGANTFALWIGGNGSQALDNAVVDTTQPSGGVGNIAILADASTGNVTGMVIEGNRISNVALGSNSVAISAQVAAFSTLVVNNRIANFDFGIQIVNAGRYRDNLTINTTAAYNGGTSEGNNQ